MNHNASQWKRRFAEAGDGTQHPDKDSIKSLRREVMKDTLEAVETDLAGPATCLAPYPLPQTRAVNAALAARVMPWLPWLPSPGGAPPRPPRVSVVKEDMLEAAGRLVARGNRVAVLNMASARAPGGGVWGGCGAQEENLHRRTDLFRFLADQLAREIEQKGYSVLYPIPDDGCLYSQRVTVLRGSEESGYPFLAAPFQIGVISCAAVHKPPLRAGQYVAPAHLQRMRAKVEVIIKTAVMGNCPVLVLGAFGCGAYGNPPAVVAELFRDALASAEAAGLSEVVFCILDDHNTHKEHNPRGNFVPFMEVFGAGLGQPGGQRSDPRGQR